MLTACRNDFRVELDWIKALPGGEEANFVMVSCVGAGLTGQTRRKMVAAKRCAVVLAFSFAHAACNLTSDIDRNMQFPCTIGATHRCSVCAFALVI